MKDISHTIENYVNHQNNWLWEKLKENYKFKLYYDPNEYSWKTRNEYRSVTIITPRQEIEFAPFTHELLHTYIEHLGMTDFESFRRSYSNQPLFSNFVFNNLFAQLYNFCAHKKMYPYFASMGFADKEFVESRIDYGLGRHLSIQLMFRLKWFRMFALDQFLGNFFALRNNVVDDDRKKCKKYLRKLHKLKPELYKIAEDFDESWSNRTDLNLLEPFEKFKNDIANWIIELYNGKKT